ncbi:MAG TPA: hydroxymethylbilane synthase [Steroidobacteraceae bacterium]|nr:hydroxymethylbilane synthase [Steroidobacteraceae bacterium]
MSAKHIGSRGSDLALWQSRTVLAALRGAGAADWHSEITVVTTRGDVDQSLYLAGGVEKGFFTKELEVALLDRRIDLVVHSLKDLPTATPDGLRNVTILPRATAADWLLVRREFHAPRTDGLLPLAAGTRVGASSLRRGALLGRFAPQAVSVPLRGNVPTRVRKLGVQDGVDAIILAGAGLSRLQLDLSAFVVLELAPEWWVPAPGQGALAAQCRAGDIAIAAQVGLLAVASCAHAVRWEREFLRVIEGGCSTPFGCHVVGHRAYLGIAGASGWLASQVELPNSSPANVSPEGSHSDEFIRGAVAGCKPVDAEGLAPGTVGRALLAR